MSSQGSVDGATFTESRLLLEAWGMWARSGDLGIGYITPGIWKKPVLGVPYSELELLEADRVVAGLPVKHKRVVKKFYLHGDIRGLSDQDIAGAVQEFQERFCESAA